MKSTSLPCSFHLPYFLILGIQAQVWGVVSKSFYTFSSASLALQNISKYQYMRLLIYLFFSFSALLNSTLVHLP